MKWQWYEEMGDRMSGYGWQWGLTGGTSRGPKRHRLSVNAIDAVSVVVYQRSKSGHRHLLRSCNCLHSRAAAPVNLNCQPCNVKTRKRLDGQRADNPAKVEIKLSFRAPAGHRLSHIVRHLKTNVGSGPQARTYSLASTAPNVPNPPVEGISTAPDGATLTQRTVPELKIEKAPPLPGRNQGGDPLAQGGFHPQEGGPPPLDVEEADLEPTEEPPPTVEDSIVAADTALDGMAPGSSVEVDEPTDVVIPEGGAEPTPEFLYPAAGAALGFGVARVAQANPLIGAIVGGLAGMFASRRMGEQ